MKHLNIIKYCFAIVNFQMKGEGQGFGNPRLTKEEFSV